MYLIVADFVQRFDIDFKNVTADDFLAAADNFAIGTKGQGHAYATIARHED